MSSSGVSGASAADIWAAATRTLTALTGQPRTDLAGSDVALWSAVARTLTALTGQPRTDLVGSDAALWSHATRALTDLSLEDVADLPALDDTYVAPAVAPSATVNTFGSWVEVVANVGNGKRLLGVQVWWNSGGGGSKLAIELGEGAAPNEAAITRVPNVSGPTGGPALYFPLWRALTDGARLSARAKTDAGAAWSVYVAPVIA